MKGQGPLALFRIGLNQRGKWLTDQLAHRAFKHLADSGRYIDQRPTPISFKEPALPALLEFVEQLLSPLLVAPAFALGCQGTPVAAGLLYCGMNPDRSPAGQDQQRVDIAGDHSNAKPGRDNRANDAGNPPVENHRCQR